MLNQTCQDHYFFPISRCRNGHLFTWHGHPPDPKHETVSSSLFNLPPVRLSSRRRAKEMPITKVIECCFPQIRLWGAFLLLWLVSALECGANDAMSENVKKVVCLRSISYGSIFLLINIIDNIIFNASIMLQIRVSRNSSKKVAICKKTQTSKKMWWCLFLKLRWKIIAC